MHSYSLNMGLFRIRYRKSRHQSNRLVVIVTSDHQCNRIITAILNIRYKFIIYMYQCSTNIILCYVYFNVKLTLFKVLGNISIYLKISIYNDIYKIVQLYKLLFTSIITDIHRKCKPALKRHDFTLKKFFLIFPLGTTFFPN